MQARTKVVMDLNSSEVHETLDNFYTSRTGIRILIGQYLELKQEEARPG